MHSPLGTVTYFHKCLIWKNIDHTLLSRLEPMASLSMPKVCIDEALVSFSWIVRSLVIDLQNNST